MLVYPATLTSDGSGYVVRFRDIPEALTQGETEEKATKMAGRALRAAINFYFSEGRPVPGPSPIKKGEVQITLQPSLGAKILLLNTMIEQHITSADLARRMGVIPQVIQRVVNMDHVTKIDTIAEALAVLGFRLDMSVSRIRKSTPTQESSLAAKIFNSI